MWFVVARSYLQSTFSSLFISWLILKTDTSFQILPTVFPSWNTCMVNRRGKRGQGLWALRQLYSRSGIDRSERCHTGFLANIEGFASNRECQWTCHPCPVGNYCMRWERTIQHCRGWPKEYVSVTQCGSSCRWTSGPFQRCLYSLSFD